MLEFFKTTGNTFFSFVGIVGKLVSRLTSYHDATFPPPCSDVKVYDPSGDSTLPTTSKKRKIEEVEPAEEEEEKPVQSKPKKIKKEKSVAAEGMAGKPSLHYGVLL